MLNDQSNLLSVRWIRNNHFSRIYPNFSPYLILREVNLMQSDTIKKKDSLRNRIIYGFGGFFLMIGGMLWNEWSYGFVFLVICFACLKEYFDILKAIGKNVLSVYSIFVGVLIYGISFLVVNHTISPTFYILLYPLFTIIFVIKLYQPSEKQPFETIGLIMLGIVYVAMSFSALHITVFQDGFYNYQIITGIFFLIWIHDIGAYFFGFRYGKHKLFERISPSKSWEGSIAGFILAAMMAVLLSLYFYDLNVWQWLGMAFIIVVVGTHGDLVESMLKRSLQIKDSSKALPGHGGFLDRFDNLLLSAPFMAIFLEFFG
jgi:phosphatidate cytidylyltransferase